MHWGDEGWKTATITRHSIYKLNTNYIVTQKGIILSQFKLTKLLRNFEKSTIFIKLQRLRFWTDKRSDPIVLADGFAESIFSLFDHLLNTDETETRTALFARIFRFLLIMYICHPSSFVCLNREHLDD
jgi:hypothetical protein